MQESNQSSTTHSTLLPQQLLQFTECNSSYYQHKWSQKFGLKQWNWSAALAGPFWFAYRKQPLWALLFLAIILGYDFWVSTSPYSFTLGIEPLLLSGFLANFLYSRSYKRYCKNPDANQHHTGTDWLGTSGMVALFIMAALFLPTVAGFHLFQSNVKGIKVQSLLWSLFRPDTGVEEIELLREDYHKAYYQGHFKKNLTLNQQALTLAKLKLGSKHQLTTALQSEFITATLESGDCQKAEQLTTELIAYYEYTYGKGHLFTTFFSNNLISNYIYQGRFDLAKSLAYNCLIIWENAPESLNKYPTILNQKALLYSNMAVALQAFCDFKTAKTYHHEALELSTRANHGVSLDSCRYFIRLGDFYKEQLDFNEALLYYNNAEKTIPKLFTSANPVSSQIALRRGEIFLLKRDYKQALHYLTSVVTMNKQLFGESHLDNATAHYFLGKVYFCQGKLSDAERSLKEALRLTELAIGTNNAHYAVFNTTLADFYSFRNKDTEAIRRFQGSLATMTSIYGLYNPRLIFILEQLAKLADQQDKPNQALDYIQRSLEIKQRSPIKYVPHKEFIQLDREGIII